MCNQVSMGIPPGALPTWVSLERTQEYDSQGQVATRSAVLSSTFDMLSKKNLRENSQSDFSLPA